MCARAVALWCALALAAGAAAYTVDCNHEYTDCDTELGKLPGEEEDSLGPTLPRISMPLNEKMTEMPSFQVTTSSTLPTRTTSAEPPTTPENRTEDTTTEELVAETVKPRPRLLNLSVDDLKNFAFALHNQTAVNTKKLTDLSDVTLDGEDEYEPPKVEMPKLEKDIPDKFYTNLQAPFHPILTVDRSDEVREEADLCRENEVSYKIGERIDRACEETCECVAGGIFDCSPRCKHPYIRRGRRINDPLCFESPVDQCCSIIACATGNGDSKVPKLEVCRYGNDTYPVGSKWNVGCEQKCSCEVNSVVTCKPRCNPLPQSDKCINVQDPKDACCEVQVCDVSQDVHEEPVENMTSTTTTSTTTRTITTTMTTTTSPSTSTSEAYTTTTTKLPETTTTTPVTTEVPTDRHTKNRSTKPEGLQLFNITEEMARSTRPLVLSEPIGSVKVLQNNSVQVNLMHMNSSKDPINLLLSNDGGKSFKEVELKYDNMILNLDSGKDYILKTRETGTKFNFTITASDPSSKEVKEELILVTEKIGCHEDGKFYAVGEEFHIGCTELCECVGADRRECAALECPAHVGLELVSKGCVRWAPTPPPRPPNCCPRAARCLSDGTCHYKEVAIPNWTEVPISLTGCEQRCFCENGELDCQEVCTPLPPLPPQSLRCPPLHRPGPVNISDEDCCKQWGCVPNAGNTSHLYPMPLIDTYYVTPMVPVIPVTEVLPTPADPTDSMLTFYRNLIPAKPIPQVLKTFKPTFKKFEQDMPEDEPHENMTKGFDFAVDEYKTDRPLNDDSHFKPYKNPFKNRSGYFFPQKPEATMKRDQITEKYKMSDHKMHDIIRQPPVTPKNQMSINLLNKYYDTATKIPVQTFEKSHYFAPTYIKTDTHDAQNYIQPNVNVVTPMPIPYFKPMIIQNHSMLHQPEHVAIPIPDNKVFPLSDTEAFPISTNSDAKHNLLGKHVTVLRTKDLTQKRPTDLQNRWGQSNTNMHVLTKSPSPYETVLMRAIPNPKLETASSYERHLKSPSVSGKPYSTLDLEHLLSQMEVESEVNRNLGRSADKNQDTAAGTPIPDVANSTPTQQTPPFLPTIPSDFHFPQDDESDYDQNNIHRPMNPLVTGIPGLPPGDENKKLSVITLESDSPTSIKMLFGLPPVLVGLRGSVDLRYTDTHDDDITHWQSQVFAPADEVLTTSRLEFRLTGLIPGTLYRLRGKLYLHNLPLEPESEVYTIRTHDLPVVTPVEEKRREINSRLTVLDVNDTVAHVSWRRFTEEELQYIDGIQIRYRPVGTPIYSMTELLHHSRAAATLRELRAGSRYEASLVLVPPPRAATELVDPAVLEFTTAPYVDPYNWSVSIEARTVGSEAAELTWRGIPSPAERWVRVYRASHACGGARREHDAFRLAARDLPPSITLTGLEPDTRCRVWLELFLTNGKIKTSNVLEINTKSLDSPEQIDNAIEASSVGGRGTAPRGDYYGALVVVGVVAALGALTSLLLLLVVVRRHRPRSVPITPVPTAPRESSLPPYDNPAYKLELQQETMDL